MSGTRTCRTCLQNFDVSETHSDNLTNNVREKIESCIPFVTLDLVKDYILCRGCIEALSSAYQYRQMCQETEEKIYSYLLHSSCEDTKSVEIDDVMRWLERPAPVDSETDTAEFEAEGDLFDIEKHEEAAEADFKVFFNWEMEEEDQNYQKFCNIEKQFAGYSIEEFYSKGISKLPECRVTLQRVSKELIERYAPKKAAVKRTRRRKRKKPEGPAEPADDSKTTNSYSCPWCGYSSTHEKELFRHLQEHNSMYSRFNHNPSRLHCFVCSYVTHFKMQLESHYLEHFIDPPFQCTLCDATFKFRTQLIKHILGHPQRQGQIQVEHSYALL